MQDGFKKSLLSTCILFLLFFKSTFAFDILPQSDTGCYLSWLSRFLFIPEADYWCSNNFYAPGAPLTWLPAGGIGLLLAHIFSNPVYDWIIPVSAVYSFFYLAICILLISNILKDELQLQFRWSLLVTLCSPILFYTSRMPLLSHSAELVFALAAVTFILRNQIALAIIFSILLTATRFNDLPIFLLILGRLIDAKQMSKNSWIQAVFALAFFSILIGYLGFIRGYGNVKIQELIQNLSYNELHRVLFGSDWGLAWSAWWWVIPLTLGLLLIKQLSWLARSALIWMIIELSICVSWHGNGNLFSYRYLIGSYAAALVIWIDLLRKHPKWTNTFRLISVTNAIWMTYLVTAFRSLVVLGRFQHYQNSDTGYMQAVGYPDFLMNALINILNPNVYRVAYYQQIPAVTSYLSLYRASDVRFNENIVSGPPLFILQISVGACCCYVLLHVIKLFQKKAKP